MDIILSFLPTMSCRLMFLLSASFLFLSRTALLGFLLTCQHCVRECVVVYLNSIQMFSLHLCFLLPHLCSIPIVCELLCQSQMRIELALSCLSAILCLVLGMSFPSRNTGSMTGPSTSCGNVLGSVMGGSMRLSFSSIFCQYPYHRNSRFWGFTPCSAIVHHYLVNDIFSGPSLIYVSIGSLFGVAPASRHLEGKGRLRKQQPLASKNRKFNKYFNIS